MLQKFKTFIQKLSTVGVMAVVVGILVLINYIVSFFPLRFDITENKIYSLSAVTKDMLKGLDDIVTIKLFFSQDLPNRVLPIRQEVESLVKEYEQVGGASIKVEVIDPSDLTEQQEAQTLGIPQLQFSGIEKDKLEVSQGFFGGAVLFGAEREAIPVFEEGGNFEYQFTSAINKLTREEVPKVALTGGHGEEDEGLELARKLLEQDFAVTTQVISTAESSLTRSAQTPTIPADIKTLLVIDPQQKWGSAEKEALGEFVNKGGSLFFALEGVAVGENLFTNPAEHDLFSFLGRYGLTLRQDLVVSAFNDIANFRTQQSIFLTPYPFWVRITPEGFSKEIPATAQLETAVFPWVSSIELKETTGIKTHALVKTVQQSYSQESNFNLQPNQEFNLQAGTGEKIVAAAAEIKAEPLTSSEGSALNNGRIVLIGDAGFLQDNFLQRNQANAVFFLNLVEWLTSDSNLAGIRARGSSFRPLVELSDTAKTGVKYGNVLIMPFLLGILGSLRLLKRR